MSTLRQAAVEKLRAWSARRHGRDSLPIKINRRRIYILPTRFGVMLALRAGGDAASPGSTTTATWDWPLPF